jgi:hypothetical protein
MQAKHLHHIPIMQTPTALALPTVRGFPVTIEERGDLTLVVGSHPGGVTEYLVCSRTLARASRVFRTMLYGGFLESKPATGDWRVHFPMDDPEGFGLLLTYLHNLSDMPDEIQGLNSVQLEKLLFIVDKYCLQQKLRIAIDAMTTVFNRSVTYPYYPSSLAAFIEDSGADCDMATISIAWYLGWKSTITDWLHTRIYEAEEEHEMTSADEGVAGRLDELFGHGQTLGKMSNQDVHVHEHTDSALQ